MVKTAKIPCFYYKLPDIRTGATVASKLIRAFHICLHLLTASTSLLQSVMLRIQLWLLKESVMTVHTGTTPCEPQLAREGGEAQWWTGPCLLCSRLLPRTHGSLSSCTQGLSGKDGETGAAGPPGPSVSILLTLQISLHSHFITRATRKRSSKSHVWEPVSSFDI